MKSATEYYKEYSWDDKQALKELRAEMAVKVGKDVSLADAIKAVEPDLVTPEYLSGC